MLYIRRNVVDFFWASISILFWFFFEIPYI